MTGGRVRDGEDSTAAWVKWILGIIVTTIVVCAGVLHAQSLSLELRMAAAEQRIAAIDARQEEQFARLLAGVQRIENKVDVAALERTRMLEEERMAGRAR